MAKILVVDDENTIRVMLRGMLEKEGHEILDASNGVEACDMYRENPVDLIITDLVMPERSGIDLILDLKAEFPMIRIMAISGGGGITGRFDYLPIAKLIGAKYVLSKPFHKPELQSMVSMVLAA
jgi:YesN/AraC family two-component response regulator